MQSLNKWFINDLNIPSIYQILA